MDHRHQRQPVINRLRGFCALTLLLLALWTPLTAGMKQQWTFTEEDRANFMIERFGFGPQGHMEVHVTDVIANSNGNAVDKGLRAGLLFIHEDALWDTMEFLRDAADDSATDSYCLLQNRSEEMWIDFADDATWNMSRTIGDAATTPGFYYLFFAQCTEQLEISFKMAAEFRNGPRNYLSAGDSTLPSVYLLMSCVFLGAAIVWGRYLRANSVHIHYVHHMMSLLLVFKTLCLFADAMRYYYMKKHGDTLTGWTTVYYVFMFLKGITLFTVILLIGMGWSLVKPHLSKRDKSVISVVLVFQVFSNTAMIVLEETDVGTQTWETWRDVLHILDLLCCLAILLPIIWSIRTLRQSSATDGKAHINLQKLTQFRSFYLLVVTYIYVTRIAIFILTASLPYNATWIAVFVGELTSVTFFTLAGYRFRPMPQNPYLQVATHIESLDEFGLEDDDDLDADLRGVSIQRKDHQRYSVQRSTV